MRWINLNIEMVRDERIMNTRMEWSYFEVAIKVEQLNDNLFSNTCAVKTNRKLHNGWGGAK